MSEIPRSILGKCFSPGAEGAQKLSLGHPKWNRNGSRMVDMRNEDWEMDRTGPLNLFRPFQTPQTHQKRKKKTKRKTQTSIKLVKKSQKKSTKIALLLARFGGLPIPLSIPLLGGLYWYQGLSAQAVEVCSWCTNSMWDSTWRTWWSPLHGMTICESVRHNGKLSSHSDGNSLRR